MGRREHRIGEGKYEKKEVPSYPMKYYADDGGEWTSSRFAERQKNMGNRRDKPSVRLVVSSGN